MKIVGLTGGIGTGKSTVAEIFMKAGIPVLDADRAARNAYLPGTKIHGKIVKAFGKGVLAEDGTVNRKKLGSLVFHDPQKREQLEKITHPEIEEKMREFIRASEKQNKPFCIIEAALIFEKNRGELFDIIIAVSSRKEDQIERLMKRDNLSEKEIEKRINAQLPLREKMGRSHFVIDNSGTRKETENQVHKLIGILADR